MFNTNIRIILVTFTVSLAIPINSPYVITYVCQNFGVRDVRGQIRKVYIRSHTFYVVTVQTIFPKFVLI